MNTPDNTTETNSNGNGNNNGNGFKKATAFLNVKIQDSKGVWKPLSKGIPLHADGSDLEKALLGVTDEKMAQLVQENRINLSIYTVGESEAVVL